MEESAASQPGAAQAPRPRRPERQQIVLRRALALGGGLIVLILIVLGVKGCLDARAHRALSDYARNVTQIVEETNKTSKDFFGKLAEPGELSVTDFVEAVNADRSAMESYASRVDGLSAPGDMGKAQSSLEIVYDLRSGAMDEIANEMSTALANVGAEKATKVIANQMEKLLASDVVYASVVRPEIDRVLADNGIEGDDVPESVFLPEGTKWLDEATISRRARGASAAATAGETGGVHGLGLLGTGIDGTALVAESSAAVSAEETPEVEVEVQNQGESTESGVTVSVTVSGGAPISETIDSIEPQETQTVVIPLTPAPTGTGRTRSRSRLGPRREHHQQQRSHLHGRIRIGTAGCEDRLPRSGGHLHRGRPARSGSRGRLRADARPPRSTTRSSPSNAARRSGRWFPSRTRSRGRCAPPSTRSPSRPARWRSSASTTIGCAPT